MKATQSEIWYKLEEQLDQLIKSGEKSQIGMPEGEQVQEFIHYGSGKKMISLEFESEKKIFLHTWSDNSRYAYVLDLNIWTKDGARFTTMQIIDQSNKWGGILLM